ncbi:hypothetical protein B6S44_28980 [Bosea sp. Tri-44]|uniref:hypothetical protein n=1 Tax=Bosea sp. Tri-44 TaxID=1972137 RepID=UPI00100E7678|nr:hypothetical protein [Bosea sp. Tri-44]RXT43098.1 hypothetical protein B6S44_28980 [Bosea sp. Tri-44]
MTRTITRAYDDYASAQGVVNQLEAAGVASSEISLLGRQENADDDSNAGEGAGIGAAVGGAAGLLAGLGLLAIPGVGPVVAAGWLASTLAGAAAGGATGGIIGAMTSAGEDEDSAHYYAETVRRGGSVVSVRAEDSRAAEVEAIMDGATPIDREARLAEYRQSGWSRFDETAAPYRYGAV